MKRGETNRTLYSGAQPSVTRPWSFGGVRGVVLITLRTKAVEEKWGEKIRPLEACFPLSRLRTCLWSAYPISRNYFPFPLISAKHSVAPGWRTSTEGWNRLLLTSQARHSIKTSSMLVVQDTRAPCRVHVVTVNLMIRPRPGIGLRHVHMYQGMPKLVKRRH